MRARTSTLLVLIALLAGGCTGGGEPEAEPTPILPSSSDPEPSPSQSEAAEEEAPEMPAAAREESFEGAEAFVRHWVDSFNFSTESGEGRVVRDNSARSCGGCRGIADQIDSIYDGGGRIESDGWEVQSVGFNQQEAPRKPTAVVRVDRSPQRFIYGDRRVERFDGGLQTYLFYLEWRGERWLTTDLDLLES